MGALFGGVTYYLLARRTVPAEPHTEEEPAVAVTTP
jgi:hypothetical protein